MFDPLDPYPAPISFAGATAIPPQLTVRAVNLQLELALLSDDRTVPIVQGFDWDGEECGLDDEGLASFVCGSHDAGWFDCRADGFSWGRYPH